MRMDLHGGITENLEMAVASARRLRGHPVYGDTLGFWQDLLAEARRARVRIAPARVPAVDALIEALAIELAERAR